MSSKAAHLVAETLGEIPPGKMLVKKTTFLKGTITASPSKSYTHRAIVIGSMNGNSRINNCLKSDDTDNTISAWKDLGAKIDRLDDGTLQIKGFEGKPKFKNGKINVGESGTLLRFALAVASLGEGKIEINGTGTIKDRKNTTIVEALEELGVDISRQPGDKVPIIIDAKGIKGGKVTVRGDVTSQVISALLIALSRADEDSTIKIKNPDTLVSRPYITITQHVLDRAKIETVNVNNNFTEFKVKGGQTFKDLDNFDVPGDYSSAAFLIAAASLIKSKVKIKNLVDDEQGDKKILDIIEDMGGKIKRGKDFIEVEGPFDLKGIKVSCRDTPDIVPVIAALAVFAKGETHITEIGHLKEKESDRILSIKEEFEKLGIDIETTADTIVIKNSAPKAVKPLDPHNDHRIAMCLSLIGLRIGDMEIKDADCINKSYPKFLQDMQDLSANIELK